MTDRKTCLSLLASYLSPVLWVYPKQMLTFCLLLLPSRSSSTPAGLLLATGPAGSQSPGCSIVGDSWLLKGMSRNQTRRKKPKGHQEKPFWILPSLAGWDGWPSPALRPAQQHWDTLGSLAGAGRRVNTLHSISGSRLEELHTHTQTGAASPWLLPSTQRSSRCLPAPLPTLPPRWDHGCSWPSHRALLMTHRSCSALIRLLSN